MLVTLFWRQMIDVVTKDLSPFFVATICHQISSSIFPKVGISLTIINLAAEILSRVKNGRSSFNVCFELIFHFAISFYFFREKSKNLVFTVMKSLTLFSMIQRSLDLVRSTPDRSLWTVNAWSSNRKSFGRGSLNFILTR